MCFSKSGVKTVTLYGQAHQPRCYPCSVLTSTKAALLGCSSHSVSEMRSILIKLDTNCLPDTKITFLLLRDMLGYCSHFGMKPFCILLLLEFLFYSVHFWLKETSLPVARLLTESARAWYARHCLAMPINGAELKILLLYKNYTHIQNSIPRHFEMVIF